MVIDVEKINEGVSNFRYNVAPDEYELEHRDARFGNEIAIELTTLRHDKKIIVGARVRTEAKMVCARCLTEFTQAVEAEFDFGVELADGAPENVELWEEDFVRVAPHNGTIKITRRIRDAILLELPMRPLCDPDCKGLCPRCGANLNIEQCKCKPTDTDNPFYKLKELLDRKGKNGAPETATLKHKNKKKKNTLEN